MEDKIKSFISKHNVWEKELTQLRTILINTELKESVKWGMPSYGYHGQNVIGIGAFKKHIGIWFHQGTLLSDRYNLLINAQEGKTKAMRSIQITKDNPIDVRLLTDYIAEAIENAKEGKQVRLSQPRKVKRQELDYPAELKDALTSDDTLQDTFKNLTPIQQYDYVEYIISAKKATTKATRLKKIIPLIKAGKPISAIWKMR